MNEKIERNVMYNELPDHIKDPLFLLLHEINENIHNLIKIESSTLYQIKLIEVLLSVTSLDENKQKNFDYRNIYSIGFLLSSSLQSLTNDEDYQQIVCSFIDLRAPDNQSSAKLTNIKQNIMYRLEDKKKLLEKWDTKTEAKFLDSESGYRNFRVV